MDGALDGLELGMLLGAVDMLGTLDGLTLSDGAELTVGAWVGVSEGAPDGSAEMLGV